MTISAYNPTFGYVAILTADVDAISTMRTESADYCPYPRPANIVVSPPTGGAVDLEYGGAYQITGSVDELGVAGSYKIRLFDRASGYFVRETWSGDDGTYSFSSIKYKYQGYFIVAFDHGDNPLNAAIADLVTPEAMQ